MNTIDLLDADERRELLRIGRATAREHLRTDVYPPGRPHRASLLVETVAVAKVWRDGELVATCTSPVVAPLYQAVQDAMVAAVALAGVRTREDLAEVELGLVVGSDQHFRETAL